jgi:hypothetical protein
VISGLCKLHNLTQDGRDQPVWVTETESYFDWIEGASGLSYANPVTLPFADFDGNDRANLLDYVLPGALPQPVLLSGGSVEVTVRNENPRVRTTLEVSTDLVEWTEILDADTDFERQDQGDGTERLVYSGSGAGEQFYGRLLVRNDELDGTPSGELPPVEPPEEEGENVALWKSTSQSSTSGDRVSDLAVDGVTDGSNGAASFNHTNTDTQAWWLVDLGRAYDIAEIQVWNRDRQPQRLTDFYVVVSESAFASTDLTPTLADPDVTAFHIEGTAGYPTTITAPPEGLRGRYVRVQLAGTGILHMAEVVINQVQ